MTTKVPMLPCPFCGGTDLSVESNEPYYMFHFVECKACDANGAYKESKEEAITAWNQRASKKLSDEQINMIAEKHSQQKWSDNCSWVEVDTIEFAREIETTVCGGA